MTMKGGGSMPRRSISSSANEVEVKKCVLLSKVMFREVLLIRICFMNIQQNRSWEISKGKLLPLH